MGINLYSLFVDLQAKGVGTVMADLRGVDAAGVKTAASLNGVSGSLDRAASASLNGTKGFRDLSGAYANQEKVLSTLAPATVTAGKATEEHAEKTKKATGAAKEHGETLHGLWGTVRQLAGAYFLFEGMHFISEAVESAAALHELSQRTGASAEALSVLQFAGRRAEVSTEGLGNAFKFMAVSLGNLRDGVDKTEGAYAKLGFTSASFKGLSPEQTFIKLAIAVGSYKDVTERAEIAQRIFGRGANTMLPLFEDLAVNGFAKTTEEAKKFHAFVTQDMADAADKVHDDWGDIVEMFKGMARTTLPLMKDAVASLYQVMMKSDSGPATLWASFMSRMREEIKLTYGDLLHLTDAAVWFTTFGHFRTHLAAKANVGGASGGADPGGVRGDNLGMGTNPLDAIGAAATPAAPTDEEIAEAKRKAAEAKRKREEYNRAVLGLANMDESMRAPDKLGFQGIAATHLATRGGVVGPLTPASIGGGSAGDDFMGGSLGGDLEGIFAQGGGAGSAAGRLSILAAFGNEARRQAVQLKVQFAQVGTQLGMTLANGFASALAAGIQGKNVFKALGSSIMQGLGGIMTQLGQALISYGVIMIKLLPFLTNIFTSGPAALAAGIALTALGAAFGSAFTGHGGGSGGGSGGGDFRDRTTQITLTANGAGGLRAPHQQVGPTIHVLGKDSAEGQRLFGEHYKAASRSRNV